MLLVPDLALTGIDEGRRLVRAGRIAGEVARTGEPIVVTDAYEDPRFNPGWDLTSGYRTRTILAVPMRDTEGKTNGVVQVLNKRTGVFTKEDAELLSALATSAGIAIENHNLRPGDSTTVYVIRQGV